MSDSVDIIEKISSSERLSSPLLSPDATRAIYLVAPNSKTGEHSTSAIWIADVNKPNSAKQFTSGLFNDQAAVFHPDGTCLIFLSDRHKAGGPAQLYKISLSGGEASPLTSTENKKGVEQFVVSQDGRYIAFTSADEPTKEQETKEEEKDDPKVFGDTRDNAKLRLYSFSTRKVRTINSTNEQHVSSFVWSPDSSQLLALLKPLPLLEFNQSSITIVRLQLAEGESPSSVGNFRRMPSGTPIWPTTDQIVSIQPFNTSQIIGASSLFLHSMDDFSSPQRLYGEVEDVNNVFDLRKDGLIAVGILNGVHTRIDIIDKTGKITAFYQTQDEAIDNDWDIKASEDGSYVFVGIRSSTVRGEAPNLWVGKTARDSDAKIQLTEKLSSHLQWMEDMPKLKSEVIRWKSEDGTEVEGIATYVSPSDQQKSAPMPTILNLHGGPYGRDRLDFVPQYNRRELLAWNGYLVLNTNYRGSSGRGNAFARAAHAGMGTVEWADCKQTIDEAIKRGLADPKRLGIWGWSQGGFLTAWGVTATKNWFKAAVMGAGVSDWGALAAESDVPDFEAQLGGSAPWTPGDRVDQRGSAIRQVCDVETPVLIIHGEKDERVPVTQGIMFYRGLKRESKYPDRAQLVVYPREPHGFRERKHVEDVMRRVVEHFETWLRD